MKRAFSILLALVALVALPSSVSAHASPVEYQPASSAVLTEAPNEVRIRFSERVEPGASRIVVADDAGTSITTGNAVVDPSDAHILSIPVRTAGDGAYFVTWSVVSSDDGHFTKGGFAYVVGADTAIPPASSSQFQIVQLSALPEATTMFVELLGNSFLWGALIMFAFVLRPLRSRFTEKQSRFIERGYTFLLILGMVLVFFGGGAHLVQKTFELAALNQISFFEALPLYLATVSGSATMVRSAVVLVFGIVLLFRRTIILAATKLTVSEIALFVLLAVFAYYRSKVSHATANTFYPEFSVLVNFFHLIGKGLWEGIIGILSLTYLSRTLRPLLRPMLERAFLILAVVFGVVGVTGTYIVWLHLKEFEFITSTLWGERFLPLLVSAVVAAAFLVYHVAAHKFRPSWFAKFLPYTLPAEFAAGVLVVFFSSLMIITSPPMEAPPGKVFTAHDQGVSIMLERAPYEDGEVLLTVEAKGTTEEPVVLLDGEGGTLIMLERRFDGGYVFPAALIGAGEHSLSVVVPQESGYDAHAEFQVERTDLDPEESKGHGRTFDFFTIVMLLVALMSVVTAVVLYVFAKGEYPEPSTYNSFVRYFVAFVIALLVVSQLVGGTNMIFANQYKKECIADGNAWHIMLPMKNSTPISSIPQEGCMALMGSFHIPDVREYHFLKRPGASSVEFSDLSSVTAGIPTALTFSIKDAEGNPALLSVQHERYVHVIVISADMRDFYHVHPDDTKAPTPEEIKNATFTAPFTFPRSGEYIIAVDYANGLSSESKHFTLTVGGAAPQGSELATYPTNGSFDGYDVSLKYSLPLAGTYSTLMYRITKDGEDVLDMTPYLGAAMHVAVVKNDLNEFVHTHGEVHIPGAPVVPVTATTVHNHAPPPPSFGPVIDAHPLFPTAGLYTVFGQFMHEGKIVVTRFTVSVE